jgi:hypothetical protein
MSKLSRSLVVLAAGAALLAAGFPAKTVSPERWTRSVCSALTDWQDGLTDAQNDADLDATGIAERKEALTQYLSDATDATGILLKRLKRAGTPDVDDGKKVASVFRKDFKRARDIFADAERAAGRLSTEDPTVFREAVLDIQSALSEGAEEISRAFEVSEQKYDVEELDQAFTDEPACSGIN